MELFAWSTPLAYSTAACSPSSPPTPGTSLLAPTSTECFSSAGRWGDVQQLAGAAIFLASDASSFVSGHSLYVDGGITASF